MKLKLAITFAFILATAGVFAQSTYINEIGAKTDNDSYLLQGSDRYYTDGYYMYFRHALSTDGSTLLQNKVLGFEFGQKIFNPFSGSIADNEDVDHPELIDRP